MKPTFNNTYTTFQKEVINKLVEIEKSDAEACASCGGEDCVCCEIYQDRLKWKEPSELFEEHDYYGHRYKHVYDFYCSECGEGGDEWCDTCDLCPDCCTCEEEVK